MSRKLLPKATFLPLLSLMLLGLLVMWLGTWTPATLMAGENLDMQPVESGEIFDLRWDPRLFDPFDPSGFIEWLHNPTGKPASVNQSAFETELEAAFNNWEAVGGLPGSPLVPSVTLGGATVADPLALDGINTVAWVPVDFGGFLARAPCYFLTAPTTTIDLNGETRLPIDGMGGTIPFPGAPGVTYPPGTAVDCWMEFDSLDSWSTAAGSVPNQFDVQSVATHEGGHFLGLSHSTVGLALPLNADTATMVPMGTDNNIDLRSLEDDDIASLIRTYARNATPPGPQTVGGRGVIRFTLGKGAACEPATGVSVWAYETSGGLDGANRVETFSGSHLRDPLGETYNGSVVLNVAPGGPYTIYARTFEDNGTSSAGAYSAFRYSNTTINSNTMDPNALTQEFDNLATVASIAAGETVDLGTVGILGCWVPVTSSDVDVAATASTAPPSATLGGQIAVTSSFTNLGSEVAGPFEVGFYFSEDATIDSDDEFSGFTCAIGSLGVGDSDTCDGTISVPAVAPGTYFVGALVDIQNVIPESDESNNGPTAPPQVLVSSDPLNPIVNGSFEDNGGSFHGWNIKELSRQSNPQLPLTIEDAGFEYPAPCLPIDIFTCLDFFAGAPTDGNFAAFHDFNGDDLSTFDTTNRRELYQDLTLPAGTTTLEFDYRAAWELFRFGSTMDRVFRVEIEPAGGGPTLLSEVILLAVNGGYELDTDTGTAPNPPYPNGYPDGIVDLGAFAGQDVRLKFVWNVPEPGTGFAFFQLDHVRLNFTVNPVTDIGITGLDAPPSVNEGDSTPVTVTVRNLGNQPVTDNIAVTLTPDANGGTVSGNPQTIVGGLTVGESRQLAFTWDSTGSTEGGHTLTASHDFSDEQASNDTLGVPVTVNLAPNTAPVVTITDPASGSAFTVGETVNFTGSANDSEEGDISGNLSWSSSLDGVLGEGANVSTSTLSVGMHTITASVTDEGGLPGSDAITVDINTPPPPVIHNVATGDFSTANGTISGGSYLNTQIQDGTAGVPLEAYQALTEEQRGGNPSKARSVLEHTWTFDVTAGAMYTITLDAYRSDGADDEFAFSYSRDNVAFTPMPELTVAKTVIGDDNSVQMFTFEEDIAGTLYVRVEDTDRSRGTVQLDTVFVDSIVITTMTGGGDNTAPTVTITGPADGSSFDQGDDIAFAGTGNDAQDGDISGNLEWSSSLDGSIGSGGSFSTSTLSVGTHVITASLSDSGGLPGSDSVTITVNPAGGILLSATGFKVKGVQHADLSWSGGTGPLNLFRDGLPVLGAQGQATPGTFTDNIGQKGGGVSYVYQACEVAAPANCSNPATVTF